MEKEMIPARCAEHKVNEAEIFNRLKSIESDINELYSQLKDKVDAPFIKEIMERSTKEIEELKNAIFRLDRADTKHSEALAGIHQILKSFKETQDLIRKDYSKLADCYTQTSIHIASITAILAERAKIEENKEKKSSTAYSRTKKDPWFVELCNKNKYITYILIAITATIIWLLTFHFDDIMTLLSNIFGK